MLFFSLSGAQSPFLIGMVAQKKQYLYLHGKPIFFFKILSLSLLSLISIILFGVSNGRFRPCFSRYVTLMMNINVFFFRRLNLQCLKMIKVIYENYVGIYRVVKKKSLWSSLQPKLSHKLRFFFSYSFSIYENSKLL